MKKMIARTVITLALFTLAGASALAGDQRDRIKFDEDVRLGGATVEAGSYDVKFDKESGELSLVKGGKVVAKAKARSEQAASKNRSTTFTIGEENGGRVLRSVSFGGSKQIAVVGESAGGAASGVTQ
jgi:hypothetical protein